MIIDDFMARYEREYDFHQEAARLCWQICESKLAQEGIRAIVTFRVKNSSRLRQKIEKRNAIREYQCIDEVYTDIVDLAGVRVALYFPGDVNEVDKILHTEFNVEKVKDNFPAEQGRYRKRFSGYEATHYHIYLQEESLADHQKRYSKVRIEIQVASVLMHAWSEVEHDLAYKPFSGELSEDEHAILDEINGLVLAGEIALERLQKAVKRRVGRTGSNLNNQYELAAYLYDNLQLDTQDSSIVMGRVDVLLRFLQLANLNRPEELANFITNLDTFNKGLTVAGQIVERILESDRDLYKFYERARREVEVRRSNEPSLRFLSRWINLEAIIRLIAIDMTIKPRMPSNSIFREMGLFTKDEDTLNTIEQLRNLRNQVVHGIEVPGNEVLQDASASVEVVIRDLSKKASPQTKKIIENSAAIQALIDRGFDDDIVLWEY